MNATTTIDQRYADFVTRWTQCTAKSAELRQRWNEVQQRIEEAKKEVKS